MIGTKERPVHVAGRALGKTRHICAFFNSKKEECDILSSFIQEGLDRGEKAVHIVDTCLHHEHTCILEDLGVEVSAAKSAGKFEILGWENAYLRDGRFDQYRMINLIEEVLGNGKAQGYPLTRLVANMEWALEGKPGVNDIVEYETRLNFVLPKYEDPVICTYDLARFSASTVMDILRTHPAVLIGGILQENPFFVPPEEFLRELEKRR